VRNRQTVERPQLLVVRLHLIGFRGGCSGHLRHQGHNGIYLRIDPLYLLQVFSKRFARGQFLGPNEPGHLYRAREAKRGSGGLRLQRRGEKACRSNPEQDFATCRLVFDHAGDSIIQVNRKTAGN
jgi:hypothetical protein